MIIYRRGARIVRQSGLRGAGTLKSYLRFHVSYCTLSLVPSRAYQTTQFEYACDVDAEPVCKYLPGGYHPTHLADVLKDGQYKILHKLGWGGYSTVWAARDQKEQRYVAIKISVSSNLPNTRETSILHALSSTQSSHPGRSHLMQMLDHFQLSGPHGNHNCIITEVLGLSVPDLIDARMHDWRLHGTQAKRIAKEALEALSCLHQQGIAHGDLHTRNIAFSLPSLDSMSEETFFQALGQPESRPATRKDGKQLEPGIPAYLVWPTSFRSYREMESHPIKLVDFGQAFAGNDNPGTLHTPLVVRAPEVIFGDSLGHRVDLWSMGCMLFELVTGQPPFDAIMATRTSVIRQALEMTGNSLPERWQETWRAMDEAKPGEKSGYSLQSWLEEVYFDEERNCDLTREDIRKVGELVGRMLKFDPAERASAEEILKDPWFEDL